MANQWFKFYGAEYLSDPKMDRLTVQERSCWLTLLCMASQSSGIIKYLSVEGLLNKSGVHFDPYDSTEWDNAQRVLQTFEQYDMVLVSKNGSVTIKNWEKRQEHNLTVAERVAKSRAKRKNVTTNVTSVTTEENRIEENRIDNKEIMSAGADAFEQFWSNYPKKELKKKTQEIWQRKKLDPYLGEILHFIEVAKNSDRWKKGYVKQPPVFLNGECWNDDVSSYQDKGAKDSKKIYVG